MDLFLGQNDIISRINYLKVGTFDWFSDHVPISVDIAVDIAKYVEPPVQWKKIVKQLQCWDEYTKAKMKEMLDRTPLASQLENFCNTYNTLPVPRQLILWCTFYKKLLKKYFPVELTRERQTPASTQACHILTKGKLLSACIQKLKGSMIRIITILTSDNII